MGTNVNIKEQDSFDLVVIGTGTAASRAAHKCSSAGWNVAIIDSLPFGGTCALRGCEPKKVLVEAAKIVDSTQRHENKGIIGSQRIDINWSDLIRFKQTFTEPFPKHREDGYIKAGIIPFHGNAQFTGPNTVKVESAEERNKSNPSSSTLHSRYIFSLTIFMIMQLN